MDADDPRRVAAITAAASRLGVDHAASAAIRALDLAGISSIVLKGASIARWLYAPEDARSYVDCDLLVAPHNFDSAVNTLTVIGFEPELDESGMPAWWREHALATFHSARGAMVDLHRSLPGVEVDDERLWATLSASTEPIPLAGITATALSEPGRLMHAALHAAQHGGTPRDLDVLSRAIDQVGEDVWRAAAELASSLLATAAFAQGLIMLPSGAELAGRLELDPVAAIDVQLRAARAVEALTLSRLIRTPGLRARLSVVRHKLFPPATFMRKWSPLARRGLLGLAIAYLYRPAWIMRRAPRALRAWREAQRRVRQEGRAKDPSIT